MYRERIRTDQQKRRGDRTTVADGFMIFGKLIVSGGYRGVGGRHRCGTLLVRSAFMILLLVFHSVLPFPTRQTAWAKLVLHGSERLSANQDQRTRSGAFRRAGSEGISEVLHVEPLLLCPHRAARRSCQSRVRRLLMPPPIAHYALLQVPIAGCDRHFALPNQVHHLDRSCGRNFDNASPSSSSKTPYFGAYGTGSSVRSDINRLDGGGGADSFRRTPRSERV